MFSKDELASGLQRSRSADLPTPFVEIDEERLERNMQGMQARANAAGVKLFPHIKTHKSYVLAQKQLDFGASGITASKPAEALIFVERGVPSVVLAYPVVQATSLDRLLPAVKARGTQLRVITANEEGVDALAQAAKRHGVSLGVFVKIDVGLGRIGVKPEDPLAIKLVHAILDADHLYFAGLLSHAGHSYGAATVEARTRIANDEAAMLQAVAAKLNAEGISVPCLSVGSTPSCLGAPLPSGLNEIRPGNYVFLDGTALRLEICKPDDLALSIVVRVISSNDERFIFDAGTKSLTSDLGAHGTGGAGYGLVVEADAESGNLWTVEKLSEEHGFVRHDGNAPRVGSRVRIFPNHACAVVAQFDAVTLRKIDGRSVVLPIDARGNQA